MEAADKALRAQQHLSSRNSILFFLSFRQWRFSLKALLELVYYGGVGWLGLFSLFFFLLTLNLSFSSSFSSHPVTSTLSDYGGPII